MNYKLQVEIKKKFGKQYVFAQKIGKIDSYVSLVVNGRKKLTAEDEKLWAMALGRPVKELFPEA